MRYSLLILALVATLGCVTQEDLLTKNVRECKAFWGTHREGLANCLSFAHLSNDELENMVHSSPYTSSLPITPVPPLMAFPSYDPWLDSNPGPGTASGPYGPMGPSWQQFNSLFQQPHQQPRERY
jgi:hypothetical protein